MLSCPRSLTPSRRLDEYAGLMVLTGGDSFLARVSNKGGRAIAAHPQDVTALIGVVLQLTAGVGKSIAAKVDEVNATDSFAELEDLRADIPDGSGSRPGSRRSARGGRRLARGVLRRDSGPGRPSRSGQQPSPQPRHLDRRGEQYGADGQHNRPRRPEVGPHQRRQAMTRRRGWPQPAPAATTRTPGPEEHRPRLPATPTSGAASAPKRHPSRAGAGRSSEWRVERQAT
jgi:hypothetical protein